MAIRRRVELKVGGRDPFGNVNAYTGIQQPQAEDVMNGPLGGLTQAGGPGLPMWALNEDPTGIRLKGKGMDIAREAMSAQDPMYRSGPLPDPQWAGFGAALDEQGVGRIRGGGSPAGSNQITGVSAQPNYLTSGQTFMGRPNQAYKPTMFQPGQTSAVTGHDYNQEQNYLRAIKGLKGAR